MHPMKFIQDKNEVLAIGLMSGTSADGMDAALVRISGKGLQTKVALCGFLSLPYSDEVRNAILTLAKGDTGGSKELSQFHFLLGELSLQACLAVCREAGISKEKVDFVGSHGQTLYHLPVAEDYLGYQVRSTFQLGEPSIICEGMGCPVVSDFRVRDMAASGNGAPLVPYSEYLLYRKENQTVGLQNIGGIGNITVLPRGGQLEETFAFDTGPGNMVMDALTEHLTQGRQRFDEGGKLAQKGNVSKELLAFLLADDYLAKEPPKTTGREQYGQAYVSRLIQKGECLGLRAEDMLATATRFTAECIGIAVKRFCKTPLDQLIVGGGGSYNLTLMNALKEMMPCPVCTNEEMGLSSEAKEAIAFAVLANECLHGLCNNVPMATGAKHPVVMGKISF